MLPSHHVILVLSLLFYAKELQPHLIDRHTGIIGKIINKLSHLFLVSLILPRIVRLMSGYFFNFIEFSLIMLLFLLIRTHSRKPAYSYCKAHNKPFGLWAEQPKPLPNLLSRLKLLFLKSKFSDFDFCFAIGDRALTVYDKIMPATGRTFLLPYGQNLSSFQVCSKSTPSHPLTILFCGQLVDRHNIRLIASSIDILDRRLGDNIPTFIFSGSGPARNYLDKLISAKPHLSEHIIVYDQPFNTFEDRVEPFKNSDILLYPSRYSGWGLVILKL